MARPRRVRRRANDDNIFVEVPQPEWRAWVKELEQNQLLSHLLTIPLLRSLTLYLPQTESLKKAWVSGNVGALRAREGAERYLNNGSSHKIWSTPLRNECWTKSNKMFEQDTNSGYDGVTFYATLRTTAPLNDTQTTLQVLGLTSYQKPSNGWTSLKNLGFNKT